MILRLERHCFDILNDLEELRPSGGFQNLILPPGPGCEISDDVFIGANVWLGHHQTCSVLQDIGGKCHPHERDSVKSRDDQTICKLVKMFADLPIRAIAVVLQRACHPPLLVGGYSPSLWLQCCHPLTFFALLTRLMLLLTLLLTLLLMLLL